MTKINEMFLFLCIFINIYCTWKCWLVQVTQWYLNTCTWIVLPPGACTIMLLRAAVPGRTATDIICGCDCWHMTIVGTDCGTNCTIIGLVVDVYTRYIEVGQTWLQCARLRSIRRGLLLISVGRTQLKQCRFQRLQLQFHFSVFGYQFNFISFCISQLFFQP